MVDDFVTVSECDDLSCSVKRQLGVFNGIILLPGNKARKLGVDSSSDIIDATNLLKNSPDLIKQDVEYTSSTGIIEVVFQAGRLAGTNPACGPAGLPEAPSLPPGTRPSGNLKSGCPG